MCFNVHRNVNDIRKQIIVFIKKHIIILFTHKSIHNSDIKGIQYRMSYPRWSTLYRIFPDSTGLCLVVPGFRWWDHKPLLRIPVLVVGSWGSWFLLLVSFWWTVDLSDHNCLFTWLCRVKRLSFKKYPFHLGVVHRPCGSCCSYVFM
jgi:hypothetical protein